MINRASWLAKVIPWASTSSAEVAQVILSPWVVRLEPLQTLQVSVPNNLRALVKHGRRSTALLRTIHRLIGCVSLVIESCAPFCFDQWKLSGTFPIGLRLRSMAKVYSTCVTFLTRLGLFTFLALHSVVSPLICPKELRGLYIGFCQTRSTQNTTKTFI